MFGEYPLILNDLTPIHWALTGLMIAGVVVGMQWFMNRSFGISSGLEFLCALGSKAPHFRQVAQDQTGGWRLPFMVGLVLAGVLSALTSGGWHLMGDSGMLDQVVGLSDPQKFIWMFCGGLCIGFGTRLAGGCTSGHGIFGISTFQWPSLVATLSFMGAGAGTTFLIYRVLNGG